MKSNATVLLVTISCAALISACSGNPAILVDPYVTAAKVEPTAPANTGATIAKQQNTAEDRAHNFAKGLANAEHTGPITRNLVALGLIGLGADAAYNATLHAKAAHRLVTGTAIVAGGAFAASRITQFPGKDQIYHAGRSAVACALRNFATHRIGVAMAEADYDLLAAGSKADIEASATALKGLNAALAAGDLRDTDKDDALAVQDLLKEAIATVTPAAVTSTLNRISGAAFQLDADVDNIVLATDDQISSNAPSLDAIQTTVTSFAPIYYAGLTAPTPAPAKNPNPDVVANVIVIAEREPKANSPQARAAARRAEQITALNTATDAAKSALAKMQKLGAILQGVKDAEDRNANAGGCSAQVESVDISPPSTQTLYIGQSLNLLVRAPGTASIDITPSGAGVTHNITAAIPAGPLVSSFVVISATDQASTTKPYSLKVSYGSQSKTVQINVAAAPKKPAS